MIPASFDYQKPATVAEAVGLLEKHGDDAKILAGGQSLLPAMKLRFNSPALLIDIRGIDALNEIKEADGVLHIGANVTHAQLAASDLVIKSAPLLAQSAAVIGDPQVRNIGTLGGSLAHADPAADYPAAILASNAKILTQGPDGERSIDAADFFQEIYMTALEPEEILVGVQIPVACENTRAVYLKFANAASRFAVVGAAVSVRLDGDTCRDVRVAFNGVSNAAFLDDGVMGELEGKTASKDNTAAAAAKACVDAEINGDASASEAYRAHLAKVFARRALDQALGL